MTLIKIFLLLFIFIQVTPKIVIILTSPGSLCMQKHEANGVGIIQPHSVTAADLTVGPADSTSQSKSVRKQSIVVKLATR